MQSSFFFFFIIYSSFQPDTWGLHFSCANAITYVIHFHYPCGEIKISHGYNQLLIYYRVVINYDFPTGVEDYVHRIGRTGRAGATGVAYTFFGDQDSKYASDLIKVLEGANQRVPPEIRDMASRGGGGMGRPRRWGSAPGGRDGGRGGRSDFGYGGRDGGRGSSWGMSNSSSSRPEKGGGRGYEHVSRDRYMAMFITL